MIKRIIFVVIILFFYLKTGFVLAEFDEHGTKRYPFIKQKLSFQYFFVNPLGGRDIEDLNEIELTQYQDFCRHMFSEKARNNENHVCHFNLK